MTTEGKFYLGVIVFSVLIILGTPKDFLTRRVYAQTKPSAVILAPVHESTVALSWDAGSGAEVGTTYKVYVGNSPKNYNRVIPTNSINTYYTLTGLPNGIYYISVTAVSPSSGNESDYSNEIYVLVTSPVPTVEDLGKITGVSVTGLTPTTATIAWTTDSECSGLVLHGLDAARLFAKVSNNQGTTDHLVVLTGLTARTRYVYKVESTCTVNGSSKTLQSVLHSFNTKAQ